MRKRVAVVAALVVAFVLGGVATKAMAPDPFYLLSSQQWVPSPDATWATGTCGPAFGMVKNWETREITVAHQCTGYILFRNYTVSTVHE